MGNYYESFEPPFFLWYRSKDRSIDKNRRSYDRSDKEIVEDISEHFQGLHHIDTASVKVSCDHNVVTLSGMCFDHSIGRYLWAIAENTLGVRHVINKLKYEADQTYQ